MKDQWSFRNQTPHLIVFLFHHSGPHCYIGSLGGALSSLGWRVKFTGVLSSACAEPTGFMHLEGPKIGS